MTSMLCLYALTCPCWTVDISRSEYLFCIASLFFWVKKPPTVAWPSYLVLRSLLAAPLGNRWRDKTLSRQEKMTGARHRISAALNGAFPQPSETRPDPQLRVLLWGSAVHTFTSRLDKWVSDWEADGDADWRPWFCQSTPEQLWQKR